MTTLRLKDGRALGYAEYGDPSGTPLFYFHGFPNSRENARLADDAARRNHVRLIALERPGFGRSDFKPGRTLADWPDDVSEAADALGVGRFGIVGLSGGGPYVAACAAKIPDRLTTAGIVSGVGPLTERAARKGYPLSTRIGMWFWRYIPFLLTFAMWFSALSVRRNADNALRWSIRGLPPVDKEILNRPEVWAAMRDDIREAFRQGGRAAAQEMRLYLRRWNVDPKTIPIEVLLWHGDADTMVPISNGRYMAETIPKCRATYYSGEGHFMIVKHAADIEVALLAAMRR